MTTAAHSSSRRTRRACFFAECRGRSDRHKHYRVRTLDPERLTTFRKTTAKFQGGSQVMRVLKYSDGWTRRHFLEQAARGVVAAGVIAPLWDGIASTGSRSEERRVGKECRFGWLSSHVIKN